MRAAGFPAMTGSQVCEQVPNREFSEDLLQNARSFGSNFKVHAPESAAGDIADKIRVVPHERVGLGSGIHLRPTCRLASTWLIAAIKSISVKEKRWTVLWVILNIAACFVTYALEDAHSLPIRGPAKWLSRLRRYWFTWHATCPPGGNA